MLREVVLLSAMLGSGVHPLEQLRDRQRVLLVFAPDASNPEFVAQQKILAGQQAVLQDYDLRYVPITVTNTEANPYSAAAEQSWMRARYHVRPGEYTIILPGKDGGVKLRMHRAISLSRITNLIDTMPMRKDEMRARSGPSAHTP